MAWPTVFGSTDFSSGFSPTHFENIWVEMGIFPNFWGENKQYLKPPPSFRWSTKQKIQKRNMSLLEMCTWKFSPQHLQRRISWTKRFMKSCSMLNFNTFQGLKAEASPSEEAHKFCKWPIFTLVDIGTNHYNPNEINEIRVCLFFFYTEGVI